ncbi:MAG: isoprenylcysteine carboxylmethyltransferase family protein [Lautropia sp.]
MSVRLELRLHPPVVAAIAAAAMWVLDAVLPVVEFALPWGRAPVALPALAGGACAVAGLIAFRRARTTIDPHRPHDAARLVDRGIYRVTRNPMYLGMLLVLVAWAMHLRSGSPLVMLPLFVAYLTRYQIVPEERALRARFGDDYARYTRAVRRWL